VTPDKEGEEEDKVVDSHEQRINLIIAAVNPQEHRLRAL
jgi:hypothetical protein